MRLAYVAGPYRSKDGIVGVKRNIDAAMEVSRELWKMGFAAICPHGNSALMDGVDIPDRVFLEGDLAILDRCDLIVMIPGWETSTGAADELAFAIERDIPAFYWPAGRRRLLKAARTLPARVQARGVEITAATAAAVLGRHAAAKRRAVDESGGNLFEMKECA